MSAATVGSRVSRDRTILIAGMGISPAVLTETVWALVHHEKPSERELSKVTLQSFR